VFLSSHQLAEVQQVCDRVAVLAAGRCVAAGPVGDVLASVGAGGIVVRVDDPQAAVAALRAEGIDARADGDGDGVLRVGLPPGDAAAVARALARHDVYPCELRPAGPTLEEAFLELTRSGRST